MPELTINQQCYTD